MKYFYNNNEEILNFVSSNYETPIFMEYGIVLSIGDGIVCCEGLIDIEAGDVVEIYASFNSEWYQGLVLNLELEKIAIVLFSTEHFIRPGDLVFKELNHNITKLPLKKEILFNGNERFIFRQQLCCWFLCLIIHLITIVFLFIFCLNKILILFKFLFSQFVFFFFKYYKFIVFGGYAISPVIHMVNFFACICFPEDAYILNEFFNHQTPLKKTDIDQLYLFKKQNPDLYIPKLPAAPGLPAVSHALVDAPGLPAVSHALVDAPGDVLEEKEEKENNTIEQIRETHHRVETLQNESNVLEEKEEKENNTIEQIRETHHRVETLQNESNVFEEMVRELREELTSLTRSVRGQASVAIVQRINEIMVEISEYSDAIDNIQYQIEIISSKNTEFAEQIAAEQPAIQIAAEQPAIQIAAEQPAIQIAAEQPAIQIAAEQPAIPDTKPKVFIPRNIYGFPQIQGRSPIFHLDPNLVLEENFAKKKIIFDHFYSSRISDALLNLWRR
jgi:hypothetical protein